MTRDRLSIACNHDAMYCGGVSSMGNWDFSKPTPHAFILPKSSINHSTRDSTDKFLTIFRKN